MGVVAHHDDLWGIDVLVVCAVQVILDGDIGRKVELRVQSAGAVAGLHAGGGGELPHIRSAGRGAVETLLDAVAFVLD